MRRLILFLFLTGIGLPMLSAIENDYEKLKLPSFLLGLATHGGHRTGNVIDDAALLRCAGFNAVRDDFGWSQCEYEKGVLRFLPEFQAFVDGIHSADLVFLHTIAYGNRHYDNADRPRSPEAIEAFCRYAEYVTGKTGARIQQIWNEWEGVTGLEVQYHNKGDVDSYIRLLKAAALRVRKVDPDVVILGNSICRSDQVIEEYLKAGILEHIAQSASAVAGHHAVAAGAASPPRMSRV